MIRNKFNINTLCTVYTFTKLVEMYIYQYTSYIHACPCAVPLCKGDRVHPRRHVFDSSREVIIRVPGCRPQAHLVNDPLVETKGHVCLKGHGHSLKERFKTDALVPFPNVIIEAARESAHAYTQNQDALACPVTCLLT